jgi:tRNA A-37 threonylcarbamoyl transferase component Bud32
MKRKILLSDKIVDELAGIHAKGTAWGEAILANMIIAKDGRPIVVDPEVRYDEGVPLPEQKARDILDFIHSLVSALRKSEKEFDIEAVVRHVIDRYPDKTVIDEFPRIAKDKSKWYRKLLRPIHELPRLGQNRKDYNAVLKVLLEQ